MATHTATLSVTKIAEASKRPCKVVGMHFFKPAPAMRLVELVKGLETSEETLETARNLSHALGKEVVEVKDSPGFVSTRVLMPWINEAILCLGEGTGTASDIDQAMRLGCNSSAE